MTSLEVLKEEAKQVDIPSEIYSKNSKRCSVEEAKPEAHLVVVKEHKLRAKI